MNAIHNIYVFVEGKPNKNMFWTEIEESLFIKI